MMKLQIIKPNDLKNMRMILSTSESTTRVAILQLLKHSPNLSYSVLAQLLTSMEFKTLAGNRMAYHIRILRNTNLIVKNCEGGYLVTPKALHLLEILRQSQEKFLTDDQYSICNNQKDNLHEFITVCRNCGVKG